MENSEMRWMDGPEAKQCSVHFLDDGERSVHTLRIRGVRSARAIIRRMVQYAYELNCGLDAEITFTVGGIEHRVDGKRSVGDVLDAHYRMVKSTMPGGSATRDSTCFALDARAALALGRIAMVAGNVDVAEMHWCLAELHAIESGRLSYHEGRDISPLLKGERMLAENWRIGRGGEEEGRQYAATDRSARQ